jgi:hypothetical protein
MFNVSAINSSVPDYMIRSSFAELGPAVGNSWHFIARPAEQESSAQSRPVAGVAPAEVQRLSRRAFSPVECCYFFTNA